MAFLSTFIRRGVSLYTILNFIKKERQGRKKSTNQSSSWHTDYIPTSLHQCTHYLLAKSSSLFKKKVTVTPLIGGRRDSQLLTLIRLIAVPQKEEIEISVESGESPFSRAVDKDDFPLPHIDILVDNVAGHEMFSFMDGFSGYNPILLDEEDREKTA